VDRLAEQIDAFQPDAVSIGSEEAADHLRQRFPGIAVHHGAEGLRTLAAWPDVDTVVNAVVGAAGLEPTLETLTLGRRLALANKESLVVGGELVRKALAAHGGEILPVDSEHNALFQCMQAGRREEVARLILTASGGPFRDADPADLVHVTPEQALAHPNWSMGSRITLDSATMVNKAFEVIEARFLFDLPYDQIDVTVHPESIAHSFVEYRDGSILAEFAAPDMRIPIQYALTYPDRVETGLPQLAWNGAFELGFRPLDPARYPAFHVVLEAARTGGTAPAAINAADEILVARFLRREIPFLGIAQGLSEILSAWRTERRDASADHDLAELLAADHWARERASRLPLGERN
jgi:1-deoxy-D-xylulose-5-phosphate reductoisomerase